MSARLRATSISTCCGDWVVVRTPNPAARLRLICFPYAGGGPSAFAAWPRALPADVEVCAVQLPGRERRVNEAPLTQLEDVIELLVEALAPWMDRPFAFFGHSVGALIAFELARRLRKTRTPGLVHVFASGRSAPHLPLEEPSIHALPDGEFLQELGRFAGTPQDVLQDQELMELFIPLLRADFSLGERYVYYDDLPLAVSISAYGGVEDESVAPGRIAEWRRHTTGMFRQAMFPGGHFFLNESRTALLGELARELRDILVRLSHR